MPLPELVNQMIIWKGRSMYKKHVQNNTTSQISLSLFCPLRTFPLKSWETSVLQAHQVLLNLASSTGAEFSSICSLAVALAVTGTPVLTLRLLGALCRLKAHPGGVIWFTQCSNNPKQTLASLIPLQLLALSKEQYLTAQRIGRSKPGKGKRGRA